MYKQNKQDIVWGRILSHIICRSNPNWYNPTTRNKTLQFANRQPHTAEERIAESGQRRADVGKQGFKASLWFNTAYRQPPFANRLKAESGMRTADIGNGALHRQVLPNKPPFANRQPHTAEERIAESGQRRAELWRKKCLK